MAAYCTNCGAAIEPPGKFCGECGQPVSVASTWPTPTAKQPARHAPPQPVQVSREDARMIAREQKQVEGFYLIGGLLWIGLAVVIAVAILMVAPDFSTGWALIIGGVVGAFPAVAAINRMIR